MSASVRWLTRTAHTGGRTLVSRRGAGRWEHFQHGSDVGIRGIGATKAQAFEQAALALIAVITAPETVQARVRIAIHCDAADAEFLLVDWINALIFEMATRRMLFCRFHVSLDGTALRATAWGEPVDIARHCPAVEAKGATFTELAVQQISADRWLAQCVVDV